MGSFNAVHMLRSRQEERELLYWLSFVAYDHRDRSFSNRIYMVYLIIFFGLWAFMTLSLIASGGAIALSLFESLPPVRLATLAAVLLPGAWCLYALIKALTRSPLVFSETDAHLICQMPLDRRHVAFRWLWMPWLKSAVPFWLLAVALGFSLAELELQGTAFGLNSAGASALNIAFIARYTGYGLRAMLAMLPFQFALFLLPWVSGVARVHRDRDRAWPILPALVLIAALLALSVISITGAAPALKTLAEGATHPLGAGFGVGNLGTAMLISTLFAVLLLTALPFAAQGFNLTRAAQETRFAQAREMAARYGMTAYVKEQQTRDRLGVQRDPARLPPMPKAGALVWKDLVQAARTLTVGRAFDWFSIFAMMAALTLMPDPGSLAFLLAVWAIRVGKLSADRLRSDLALWPLARQLPVTSRQMILYDTVPAAALCVLFSLSGLAVSTLITGAPAWIFALLLPGMAASVAWMSAYDVIRRSRSNLLINGSAPGIGAGGIILGLICGLLPLAFLLFASGITGLLGGLVVGWLAALLGLSLSVNAMRSLRDAEM